MSNLTKHRTVTDAVYAAIKLVAKRHDITVSDELDPIYGLQQAFAELVGHGRERVLWESGSEAGRPKHTVSHDWGDKRHLVEEVIDEINDGSEQVMAGLARHIFTAIHAGG